MSTKREQKLRDICDAVAKEHTGHDIKGRAKASPKPEAKDNRKLRDIISEIHGARGINGPWAKPKPKSKGLDPRDIVYDDMTNRDFMARLKEKPSPKCEHKANPIPETGIDKILAHLIKHKDQIGAIVVGVAAKPHAHITAQDGDEDCDGLRLAADVTTFDGHGDDNAHTILTRGLVANLGCMEASQ